MKWQTMFKGDYLTAAEFGGRQPTFTIVKAEPCLMEEETDGVKKKKTKAAVSLLNVERPWILCKTTAMCLAAMFGDETKNWEGKRVTLYADPNVRVGREIVDGIRVLGSPDLEADKSVSIKLPRKKAFVHHLKRTQLQAPKSAVAPVQPAAVVAPVVVAPVVVPPAAVVAPAPVQQVAAPSSPAPFVPPSREEVAAAEAEQSADGVGF